MLFGNSLGHFNGIAGIGGPNSMALVPITLQAPDGGVTVAYQLQPVPPLPSQDTGLTDVSGSILRFIRL